MGAVWDQHLVAGLAATAVIRLDQAQSSPLAVSAGRRLQAHPIHRRQRQQRALQLPHQAKRALGSSRWMVGMQVGKVIQPGERFVDRRVVLHGARAQWVEALVQVEI